MPAGWRSASFLDSIEPTGSMACVCKLKGYSGAVVAQEMSVGHHDALREKDICVLWTPIRDQVQAVAVRLDDLHTVDTDVRRILNLYSMHVLGDFALEAIVGRTLFRIWGKFVVRAVNGEVAPE
jgi:hypothetical protein